ncbi:MAG: molybdopterin cofactor-binding domain-containing protein [Pseudolabrys sp.]
MEPQNCTVRLMAGACEIWTGTQVQSRAQEYAAKAAGLPIDSVTLHNHYIGGGFGRRLEADMVASAVRVAKEVPTPIKVVWTREEDMRHDVYRPAFAQLVPKRAVRVLPFVPGHFKGVEPLPRCPHVIADDGHEIIEHDLRQVGVQLFGEDLGARGVDALPHLGLRYHQRGLAGIVDADERIRRELAVGMVGRLFWFVDGGCAQRPLKGQHKAAGKAALQDNPTRKGGAR